METQISARGYPGGKAIRDFSIEFPVSLTENRNSPAQAPFVQATAGAEPHATAILVRSPARTKREASDNPCFAESVVTAKSRKAVDAVRGHNPDTAFSVLKRKP